MKKAIKIILIIISFIAIFGTAHSSAPPGECANQYYYSCVGNALVKYECGNMNNAKIISNCAEILANGIPMVCQDTNYFGQPDASCYEQKDKCVTEATTKCIGNEIWHYNSCNVKEYTASKCGDGTYCHNQTEKHATCVTYSKTASQKCENKAVYWYDSFGVKGEKAYSCASWQKCENSQCVDDPSYKKQPYHFSCVKNLCKKVQGIGKNECTTKYDCPAMFSPTTPQQTVNTKSIPFANYEKPSKSFDIPQGEINNSFFGSGVKLMSDCRNLPNGKTICDFQPFRITTYQHIHADFVKASCIPYQLRQAKIPHIHVEIFQEPLNELFFDLRVGVYSENGKKCTFVYEDKFNYSNPYCKKYCESEGNYTTPKNILENPARYPIKIPSDVMRQILYNDGVNGDWSTDTPIISVDDSGMPIATLIITGIGTVIAAIGAGFFAIGGFIA